ncbi:MAG TPA: tetratricopeptide repeat protein [Chitinispirillaceae bacterium]|nr:tetratricopeptide repeat protein [Chitinispirillaceae bacterium]
MILFQYSNKKRLIFITLILGLSQFYLCTPGKFPVVRPVADEPNETVSKSKAQEYFVRARDYERRGLNQSAERHYEMAYELDPSSDVLKEQLIRKYLENGKYAQSLLVIKKNRTNEELTRDEKRTVATIYLKMGEYTKAVELFENITDKTEEEVYSLGLIYESIGNFSKALENYSIFYSKNSDATPMGFKIGKLLLNEKRYSDAESLFLQMQKKSPDDPGVITNLGLAKLFNGDTVSALHCFDSALAIDSVHEEALRSKAQVFMNRNSYSEPVACYEKLYQNSEYGEVYGRTLSLLYYYNRQFDKAENLLNSLLSAAIDDYELHYYLGLVHAATGKNNEARIEFEKALSMKLEFDDAWRELCYVAVREKNFNEALSVAKRYTDIFANSPAAWRLTGYVYSLKMEYKGATEALRNAVKLDSTNTQLWFELGCALERDGKINAAADAFLVVLKHRPGNPAAANYLGYMWAEKGMNLDSSASLVKTALRQDENNGAYLDSYAWIFYQMGNVDSADVYIRKALARIDDDPVIYSHFGEILFKKGDHSGAIDALKRSVDLKHDNPDEIRSRIIEIERLMQSDRQ